MQSQHVAEMKTLENENKIKGEKMQRLKQENETIKGQLREEKKKSEDLLCQVSGWIWRFKIISNESGELKSHTKSEWTITNLNLDIHKEQLSEHVLVVKTEFFL